MSAPPPAGSGSRPTARKATVTRPERVVVMSAMPSIALSRSSSGGARPFEEHAAQAGQADLAGGALEQSHAERGFEAFDAARQAGAER